MRIRPLPACRRAGLLLALLLVLPVLAAEAGSERDPEIVDPPGDVPDTSVDIVAAWFEAREEGLRFHVKTVDGSLPRRNPDRFYWVQMRVEGTLVSAGTGFDGEGRQRGYLGPLGGSGSGLARGGLERADNGKLLDLDARLGRPSVFSATIPWDAVPALQPGVTLTNLATGTAIYDRANARWIPAQELDQASATHTYVARPPAATPGIDLDGPWVAPVVVAACVLLFAGAGALVAARRNRRRGPPSGGGPR